MVSAHCLFLALAPPLRNPVAIAILRRRPETSLEPRQHLASAKKTQGGSHLRAQRVSCLGGRGRIEYKAMVTIATLLSFLLFILFACLLFSSPFYFISLFSLPIVMSNMVGWRKRGRKGTNRLTAPRAPLLPWGTAHSSRR